MHRALGIGVLVIVAALGALVGATPAVRAATVNINLHGSLAGWSYTANTETIPGPTITTNVADTVVLNLTSDDGISHRFYIDVSNNNQWDPAEPESPAFSGSKTYTISPGAAPAGTFTYHCVFHSSMHGTWIVLGSAANDTTPPAIASAAVNPPSPLVNGTVTVSATVTDAGGSGVANVSAHVVGPSFNQNLTMTGSGSAYSASHVFTTAGNYTVTIWARDAAGNNASASLSFTVSAPSPPPAGGNPPADNTALWAGVAVVVIIVFLLLALMMWRRGAKKPEPPKT